MQDIFVEIKEPVELDKDRKYLLLLEFHDEVQVFEFKKGRVEIYEYLKSIVEDIDLIKSKIISEKATIDKRISVYEFLKFVSEKLDDDFNVDNYIDGDYIGGDYNEEE